MTFPLILPSPEIWHRDDLPLLCNWRKLYRCVEVGVDRGNWSRLFLDRFPQIKEWWGVDDWSAYGEMNFDREADYLMAVANIQPHSPRAKLIRASSAAAASCFGPGSVDFVYVDAAHDFDSVATDLWAWWPTISDHGILAGHDWTDHPHHEGVKRAVAEFAKEHGLKVYLTAVDGYDAETCPSWYMYKSGEIPGSDWRRC